MKRFYVILIFTCWGCMAQSPIKSLYDDFDVNGAYYKDTFNDYDRFAGTWTYNNGATSLTIVLQKKLRQPVEDYGLFYELDFMIGGYRYVENGVEKINTMPQLSQNVSDVHKYYMYGYTIAGPGSIYCFECSLSDRTLLMSFTDPDRDIFLMEPEMLFKRVDSDGIQRLELDFRTVSAPPEDVDAPAPQYSQYTVPFGKYILTKVN